MSLRAGETGRVFRLRGSGRHSGIYRTGKWVKKLSDDRLRLLITLLGATYLTACTELTTLPSTEKLAETRTQTILSPPHGAGAQSIAPHEVVVRLCFGVADQEVEKQVKVRLLVINHRSSPQIMTLGWSDDRSMEQVIQTLKQESSVFCAAQPNYKHQNQTVQ